MTNEIKIKIDATDFIAVGNELKIFLDKNGKVPVKSKKDMEAAGIITNEMRKWLKKAEEERKKLVKPLNDQKDIIQKQHRELTAPMEEALSAIDESMIAWSRAEEKRIEIENLKRIAIAEKEAEEKRLQAEKEAQEALKSGDHDKAQDAIQKAQEVVVDPKLKETTKVTGFATRTTYSAEVVDFSKLPEEFKIPNMEELNRRARASGKALNIPGVKVVENISRTGRTY